MLLHVGRFGWAVTVGSVLVLVIGLVFGAAVCFVCLR